MNYRLRTIAIMFSLCFTAGKLMAMEKPDEKRSARICINDGTEMSVVDLDDASTQENSFRFSPKEANKENNKLLVREENVKQSPQQNSAVKHNKLLVKEEDVKQSPTQNISVIQKPLQQTCKNTCSKIPQEEWMGNLKALIRYLDQNASKFTANKVLSLLPKPYYFTPENENYSFSTFCCFKGPASSSYEQKSSFFAFPDFTQAFDNFLRGEEFHIISRPPYTIWASKRLPKNYYEDQINNPNALTDENNICTISDKTGKIFTQLAKYNPVIESFLKEPILVMDESDAKDDSKDRLLSLCMSNLRDWTIGPKTEKSCYLELFR